jgi:hypothetical protein
MPPREDQRIAALIHADHYEKVAVAAQKYIELPDTEKQFLFLELFEAIG